jgi:hypothetical protein
MSSEDSPDKNPGFKVTDRRSFTSDAGDRAAAEAPPLETPDASPRKPGAAAAPPTVDFHTFVLSLGSSVLLHLGELEPPEGETRERDLSLAKHTIDILAMLRDKTRGNLTPAEDKLIEGLLYDLRLRYVEALKQAPASKG